MNKQIQTVVDRVTLLEERIHNAKYAVEKILVQFQGRQGVSIMAGMLDECEDRLIEAETALDTLIKFSKDLTTEV